MQATQIAQVCRHVKWRFIAALYAGWFPGASRSGLVHVIDFGMPDKELASFENERRVVSSGPARRLRVRATRRRWSLEKYEQSRDPDGFG